MTGITSKYRILLTVLAILVISVACTGESDDPSPTARSTVTAAEPADSDSAGDNAEGAGDAPATATPAAAPAAGFSFGTSVGQAPLPVAFEDLSTGDIESWLWHFGDGSTSRDRSPAHTYEKAGSYEITLQIEGPGGRDELTAGPVVVAPGDLHSVLATPAEPVLRVSESVRLTATAFDVFGNEIPNAEFTWTVTGTGLAIDESGRLQAGTVAGKFEDTLTLETTVGRIARLETVLPVVVEPGPIVSLEIDPPEFSLIVGSSTDVAFRAFDLFGNEAPDAIGGWSVDRQVASIRGRVLEAGTVAGHYPQAVLLTVVRGDQQLQAGFDLTLETGPLAKIMIEPNDPIIGRGESKQFSALVTDNFGNPVDGLQVLWEASGGLVSQDGAYTAGQEPGRFEVRATAVSGRTVSGKTNVDVPVISWEFRGGTARWEAVQHVSDFQSTEEGLTMRSVGNDPILESPVIRPGDEDLLVRVRMRSIGEHTAEMWGQQGGFQSLRAFHDGEWHEYEFHLPPQPDDTRIRFDPMHSPGEVTIDYMVVIPNPSQLVPLLDPPVYVRKFGTQGTNWGEFDNATRVTTDSEGNIYTTSHVSSLVQKFDRNGKFLLGFGGTGSGPGKFQQARGIAVNDDGRIFVADMRGNRINVFDANGEFLFSWGRSGGGQGEFNGPHGVAIGQDGNVYVTDRWHWRIQVFSPNGDFVREWNGSEDGGEQLQTPTGIAIDHEGNVYVSELQGNRIQQFTADGRFIRRWGTLGTGVGRLWDPGDIAIGRLGEIYVPNEVVSSVQVFSPDGRYITGWGKQGFKNGEFNGPFGITVDPDGRIIVADSRNFRFQIFEPLEIPPHLLAPPGE